MKTEEQKKDEKRLQSLIEREGLVSVMNNTKWENLRSSMLDLKDKAPMWKVTCLRSKISESYWDGDWCHHLPTFKFIEYLDIDPIQKIRKGGLVEDEIDNTKLIINLLEKNLIPFSIEGKYLRIWGYTRAQNYPSFYK